MPDVGGYPSRADELMVPDAALRPLLAADTPIGVLDPTWAGRFDRSVWTAIGVLDGFAVVVDEDPTGPDHDLDDEERWWDTLDAPPRRLAAVRDPFSNRIVGWRCSDRCDTDLILGALEYAIWTRDVRDGAVIHHSDRGSNYTSLRFSQRLGDHGILASMGSVGDSYDNALMENFFSTLKTELAYRKGAAKTVGHTRRIIKSAGTEQPHGQWNTLELYCVGQSSVHVVNGTPNMALPGLRRNVDGRDVPLMKGRLQLQSEGAEVFYRNIVIRSIRELPRLSG